MKLPVIIVATLIVVVTLVANSGAGSSLLRFVQLLPGKDLAGHFGLYAALGFTRLPLIDFSLVGCWFQLWFQ